MIAALFIGLIALIMIGAPIAISIGLASVISMVQGGQTDQLFLVAQRMVTALDSTVLLAIPLFILAGAIMGKGGISWKIIDLCQELFGWMPGSLGVVTVVACMFFAAISGSAPATVAAIGTIMIPAMIRDGYPAGYAAALSAAGGIIGTIIPPSIPFVNYALITGESVSELFAAGVIPGILMGIFLSVWNVFCATKYHWGTRNKSISMVGVLKAFKEAVWALLMPGLILGGIYGGFFTPTEAAAVACVYGFIAAVFIYRGIKLTDMYDIAFDAVKTSSMILLICATANVFSLLVTKQQVPAKLSEMILGVTDNWVIVLLMINIILLINGCFMETTASTYIYTPILFPLVTALGIDPIQFGVIMVMNLTMGLITPPLGINLFVANGIDKRVVFSEQVKHIMPMFIILCVLLLMVSYMPGLSLTLVDMMRN